MKPSAKTIRALGFCLAVSANSLVAQPYHLDESGNGTYNVVLTQVPMPSEVAPDPSGGITNASVLIYNLEASVVSGDVALLEPGQSTISKLLRFTAPDPQGNSHVIFYSQADGTLAGVGIPYAPNPVQVNETRPTTTWNPRANQPGATLWGGTPVFDLFAYFIHVSSPTPPVSFSGTNLIWNYSMGLTNAQFFVIASTNLALPLANWTRVATNQFDQNGTCILPLPFVSSKPSLFYGIAVPTP